MKKKLLIVFGIFVGLIVIISLALEFFLDLNTYKEQIASPMGDALQRQVDLGNISHTLWKGPGIQVKDVTIFEKDQSNFVKVKNFVVKVKILSLLSKKVEIAKIILDEPEIVVTRNSKGEWNFDDLLGKESSTASTKNPEQEKIEREETEPDVSETPSPIPEDVETTSKRPPTSPSEKPSSPLSQFTLEMFQLTDGKIRIVDAAANMTTELSNINADVKDVSLNSALRLKFSADINDGAQGRVEVSGQVGPIPADGNFERLTLDFSALLKQIDIAHFQPYYQTTQEQGDMLADQKLDVTVTVKGEPGGTLASKANISLNGATVDIKGNVRHAVTKPQLDLEIDNQFHFESLLASFPILTQQYLPKELALGGQGKIHLTPAGTLDNLRISGSVDLTKGKVVFGEYFDKPQDIPSIIDFDTTLTKDTVDINHLKINLNDVLLDVAGMISGLQQEAVLELSLTSNSFSLNQLSSPLLAKEMNPSGTTKLAITVNAPLKTLGTEAIREGTIRLTDVGVSLPQLDKPIQDLNALVALRGQEVTVEQLSVNVGESSLVGTVKIQQAFTTPAIEFDLHAPRLNIDEFITASAQATIRPSDSPFQPVASMKTALLESSTSSAASEEHAVSEETLLPSNISAQGTVKIDQGQVQDVHFAKLSADVNLEKSVLNVDNLLFNLYDGKYQGTVMLDGSTPDPRYAIRSKLVHVDTNQVLTDSVSLADVLYGFVFANAAIQGQGFEPEQLVKTLTGKGVINVAEGKLATFDLWAKLAQIFQQFGSLAKAKELIRIGNELARFTEGTPFSRLEGSFNLKNGNAGSSDMILELDEQDLHLALLLDGDFGLDTSLDFIGKIRFSPESKYYKTAKKYFWSFKQSDGSIELPFPIPIGGTLLKPEFNMQTVQKSVAKFVAEMAKQAVKRQIQKEGEKILEKEGKKLLDGLFKRMK